MPYELEPRHPIVDGNLEIGYGPLAVEAMHMPPGVLAIDGPAAVNWMRFIRSLAVVIEARGIRVRRVDVREQMRAWPEIEQLTETLALRDDPIFATVPAPLLGAAYHAARAD